MPKTDDDPLGDQLTRRLRAELNRVQPRWSPPRYLSPTARRVGVWRFGSASLVAAVACMLALTAFAATGSPNPAVWTQRIVTTVDPNAASDTTPVPTPAQAPSPHAAAPAPPAPAAKPTSRTEPPESPEASPTPEPGESPGPNDSHDGQQTPSPSPSPSPGDR